MARPRSGLAKFLGFPRRRFRISEVIGRIGVALFGGLIQQDEKAPDLASHDARYKLYGEILLNVAIVAAGIRHYLNVLARVPWTFTPSEADTNGEHAELAEKMLTKDPATPWPRIVRRASMYRAYGFSIQEWWAKRHEDGHITLADVAPRSQSTIKRWHLDDDGSVLGMWQTNPQNYEELYLPREKVVYIADDSLNDSPEGLGIFRQLVEPTRRLMGYLKLEEAGFATDLRGKPKIRMPISAMDEAVKNNELSQEDRAKLEKPYRDFASSHFRGEDTAVIMDSASYPRGAEDDPSPNYLWDIELMNGGATAFREHAAAIERETRNIARILGVEHLMMGTGGGSLAMHQDKSENFFLMADGVMRELIDTFTKDLLERMWILNGFDPDTMPTLETGSIRPPRASEIATILRDLATAGATLDPRDEIVNFIRSLLGAPAVSEDLMQELIEAMTAQLEGDEDEDLDPDNPDDPDDDSQPLQEEDEDV